MILIKTLLFAVLCGIAVYAGPIAFSETQLGIGTFNGTPYNNAMVSVVLTGDTSSISQVAPGIYILPGTATVTVAGIGTGTFTDQIEAFVNQNLLDEGIADQTFSGNVVLATFDSGSGSYALNTSSGPVTGNIQRAIRS
jgi:hypothetical protein